MWACPSAGHIPSVSGEHSTSTEVGGPSLARYTRRQGSILEKATLVNHTDRIRISQIVSDIGAQPVTQDIGIPVGPPEQVLKAIGIGRAGDLGQAPRSTASAWWSIARSFHLAAVILHLALARVNDLVIDTHRYDMSGPDAHDIRREIWHNRFSAFRNVLNGAAHYDEAWLPGR